MAMIYGAGDKGQIKAFNTLGDAKVGRWCGMDEYPDRCYCWNPDTMLHGHATHYVLRYARAGRGRCAGRSTHREGRCVNCADKRGGGKLYKIPASTLLKRACMTPKTPRMTPIEKAKATLARRLAHQRGGYVRGTAEYLGGTRVRFTWPCGHTQTQDFSKGPVHRRMSEFGCRFLTKYWQGTQGVNLSPCKRCARATK